MSTALSTALIDLTGELPAVRAEPTAARTGVWTIPPNLALRWGRLSPTPCETDQVDRSGMAMIHALGMLSAVLVAGVAGGVGAWALCA